LKSTETRAPGSAPPATGAISAISAR